MWFEPCMDIIYKCGIEPAIEAAGYQAFWIDRKNFLEKVDDEFVAEIRKLRFIVADFTTNRESGARGSVYYEGVSAKGWAFP